MRRHRGYTLVEMLVVLFIISVLAGLLLGGLSAARRHNQIQRQEFQINTLKARLIEYETDHRDFPLTQGGADDKSALIGGEVLRRELMREDKGGPYLKGNEYRSGDNDGNGDQEILDVWGRPIRYLHHKSYLRENPCKRTFRLWSAGPDGISDPLEPNSDDITSWDKTNLEQSE
jgi:prepilin-type N-terminal cleavage/methylation domain-containing protein